VSEPVVSGLIHPTNNSLIFHVHKTTHARLSPFDLPPSYLNRSNFPRKASAIACFQQGQTVVSREFRPTIFLRRLGIPTT
jgi:hypothetical protein